MNVTAQNGETSVRHLSRKEKRRLQKETRGNPYHPKEVRFAEREVRSAERVDMEGGAIRSTWRRGRAQRRSPSFQTVVLRRRSPSPRP